MSHAAVLTACQMPDKSGLPSAVRDTEAGAWPRAADESATNVKRAHMAAVAIVLPLNRFLIFDDPPVRALSQAARRTREGPPYATDKFGSWRLGVGRAVSGPPFRNGPLVPGRGCVGAVLRGASTLRAQEKIPSIGERYRPAVGHRLAVLGAIAFDDDLAPNRKVFFPEASPQERVRSDGFDRPILHLAVRALRVDVNPSVGVHPFHLREGSSQRDRLFFVEFRGK